MTKEEVYSMKHYSKEKLEASFVMLQFFKKQFEA